MSRVFHIDSCVLVLNLVCLSSQRTGVCLIAYGSERRWPPETVALAWFNEQNHHLPSLGSNVVKEKVQTKKNSLVDLLLFPFLVRKESLLTEMSASPLSWHIREELVLWWMSLMIFVWLYLKSFALKLKETNYLTFCATLL